MKQALMILFCFFSFCRVTFSQTDYRKYKQCYFYIDSIMNKNNKRSNLNASSLIRFEEISPFESHLGNISEISKTRNAHEYYDKYYFDSYVDNGIDSLFNKHARGNEFLIFSRPVVNSLIVLLLNGEYDKTNYGHIPYFGEITKYLFIFDKEDRIVKVFTSLMAVN